MVQIEKIRTVFSQEEYSSTIFQLELFFNSRNFIQKPRSVFMQICILFIKHHYYYKSKPKISQYLISSSHFLEC